MSILLSNAWATTAVSPFPRSLRRKERNGTTIADSSAVTVPRAPLLQFSLNYWANSFHCSEHLVTFPRGPIDQILSRFTCPGRSVKVAARFNPSPIGTGIKRLSKDCADHRKSTATINKRFSSNLRVDFFSASTRRRYKFYRVVRHLVSCH